MSGELTRSEICRGEAERVCVVVRVRVTQATVAGEAPAKLHGALELLAR